MGCQPSSQMLVKTMTKTESCPNLNGTSKTIEKKQIGYKISTWGGPVPSRKKTDLRKKQILAVQERNKMRKRYKILVLQEIVQCQNQSMFELTINRNSFNQNQPKLYKSATAYQIIS